MRGEEEGKNWIFFTIKRQGGGSGKYSGVMNITNIEGCYPYFLGADV